ncbi:hypothetical protein LTR49_026040 [Elasticomyces elasticus]|nr:hypothetical protein LTR49_026040 [Elasticomyces elasticus]
MSDLSLPSTSSETYDPTAKVHEWINDIDLANQIGTSLYATLGQMLDTDQAIALMCPRCSTSILMMHPVWSRAPEKEVSAFARNGVETTWVMGLSCDACGTATAENHIAGIHLRKDAVLNSDALMPLKTQGKDFRVVTVDVDDAEVLDIKPDLLSALRLGLHILQISKAGIHAARVT